MRSLLVLCWIVLVAGCHRYAHQYTLTVDLADHSKSTLCHREVQLKKSEKDKERDKERDKKPPEGQALQQGGNDGAKAPQECADGTLEPFAAQPLSTPATLTVKLNNPAKDSKYDLRVEQFSREASAADTQQILEKVARNAAALGSLLGKDKRGEAVIAGAASAVKENAPQIANAVAAQIAVATTSAQPARLEPAGVFGRLYFDSANKKLLTAEESRKASKFRLLDTNAPPAPAPPPREVDLDDADLTYLGGFGIGVEQLADFVLGWCSAESFGPKDEALKERFRALEGQPDTEEMRRVLNISSGDLGAMLVAGTIKGLIDARFQKLINDVAASWDAASPAAQTFYLMRLGETLGSDLSHCQHNIEFLLSRIGEGEPRKKLEALRASEAVRKLTRNANRFARAFEDVFGSILQQALVQAEQILELNAGNSFSTITLEPGRLELGVGQIDAGTGRRTEVVSYKVKIGGIERLAILLGPAFTYCSWGCLDRIDQIAEQPMDPAGTAHAIIDRTDRRFDFSFATALHWTFMSTDSFGIGAVIGYPLGTAPNTSANVLAGIGFRHDSGIEIALGVHAFATRTLKSNYATPIDLAVDGNQGLTVDSVTEDTPQVAAFFMLGFAPDVISFLGK